MLPLERLLFPHWFIQALRILFVAYLFLSLWAAGRFFARFLSPRSVGTAGQWLLETAVGFALYSMIVRTLGFVGLVTREVILALLLLPAALLWRWRGGARLALSLPSTGKLWILLGLVLLPLSMAFAPAVSHDALVYQLRFPEMTLWSGTWAIDPANSPSFFPAATGTLYLAALSLDPTGVTTQLIHYGFFVLTVAALIVLGRRFSEDSAGGEWGAILFASVPAVGIVAGWSWSDMPLCFALLVAALALLDGEIATAILALGLAASIKYSGLALGLPLAVVAAALGIRRRQFKSFALGAAAGLLVLAPWYAANWIRMGNPVYPLLPTVFGGPPETAGHILNWNATPASGGSWWTYVLRPATLDADVGGFGFFILIGAALGLGLIRNRRRAATTLVLAGFGMLLAFAPAARILLPPLAGACLLAGLTFEELPRGTFRVAAAALGALLVLRGAALIAAHNSYFFDPLPCAVGIEKESAYRLRNRPTVALYDRAETGLPEKARVLVFGESQMFGFPRPTVAGTTVDPPAVTPFLRGASDSAEVFRRLARVRITHLLVSIEALHPAKPDDVWSRGLTAAEMALLDRVLRGCRVVDREKRLVLFEVPRSAEPPPAARS